MKGEVARKAFGAAWYEGGKRKLKEGEVIRAAWDGEHLKILCEEAESAFPGTSEMTWAYQTIFTIALRKHEYMRMLVGDYDEATKKILLRGNKAANATNQKDPTQIVPVLIPHTQQVLAYLQKQKQHGEHMFNPKVAKYELLMRFAKQCAAKHRWAAHEGINYDGLHCLRHGGTQHLKAIKERGQITTSQYQKAIHMAKSTCPRYEKPNADRRKRAREED